MKKTLFLLPLAALLGASNLKSQTLQATDAFSLSGIPQTVPMRKVISDNRRKTPSRPITALLEDGVLHVPMNNADDVVTVDYFKEESLAGFSLLYYIDADGLHIYIPEPDCAYCKIQIITTNATYSGTIYY